MILIFLLIPGKSFYDLTFLGNGILPNKTLQKYLKNPVLQKEIFFLFRFEHPVGQNLQMYQIGKNPTG